MNRDDISIKGLRRQECEIKNENGIDTQGNVLVKHSEDPYE